MTPDPAELRQTTTAGWQHLNLSYDQVIGTLNYQDDGDPSRLPPVLADRRESLLADAEPGPALEPAVDRPVEEDDLPEWDTAEPTPPTALPAPLPTPPRPAPVARPKSSNRRRHG